MAVDAHCHWLDLRTLATEFPIDEATIDTRDSGRDSGGLRTGALASLVELAGKHDRIGPSGRVVQLGDEAGPLVGRPFGGRSKLLSCL